MTYNCTRERRHKIENDQHKLRGERQLIKPDKGGNAPCNDHDDFSDQALKRVQGQSSGFALPDQSGHDTAQADDQQPERNQSFLRVFPDDNGYPRRGEAEENRIDDRFTFRPRSIALAAACRHASSALAFIILTVSPDVLLKH